MPKMGVYRITNTDTGKTYIGSSKNITSRFGQHRDLLRKAKHNNDDMIADWKTYGPDSFEFKVVELVGDQHALLSREEFWIKEALCKRTPLYNKVIDVGRCKRVSVRITRPILSEIRSLISVNPRAAGILMFFLEHMDDQNRINCTYAFMQKYFVCSRLSVSRAIRILRESEYIQVEKNGTFNVYVVNYDMFSIYTKKAA